MPNCPYCGGKYTVDKGIKEDFKNISHTYSCQSCNGTFVINTAKVGAQGTWLMTFASGWYQTSTIEVYKTTDGKINYNQSHHKAYVYRNAEGRKCVGSESKLTYITRDNQLSLTVNGKYLQVSSFRHMNDSDGAYVSVETIKMNDTLKQQALSNPAMKVVWDSRNDCFDMRKCESDELLRDICLYLRPFLGVPTEKPVESGGCYVATAVYGSYDCPQVWTLRRFRDNTLAETWYGRVFIHAYYAISPTLVKWFGNTEWFKQMWRGVLDNMVESLNADGVEDTPYEDKEW